MSMREQNEDMKELQDKEHLSLFIHDGIYAIFKDENLDLYYFSKIDVHFKPLRLYDGEKEDILNLWKAYIETGNIFWSLLDG